MADTSPLTQAETAVLLSRARDGDADAMAELVVRNMALIRSVALRFRDRGTDLSDLVQIGAVGFIKAVRGFDPSFGTRFSTYAVPMTAGEIRRFLRDDGMVKVSRRLKELAAKLAPLMREAEENGGAKLGDIARSLGVSREEAAAALEAALPCCSLSDPIAGEDGGLCRGDMIEDPKPMETEAVDRVLLEGLLGTLAPRERSVVELRYFRDLTQAETARRLGLSQAQASRLEKSIISKLRRRAGADDAACAAGEAPA
ncbi:MAG: sigma-70 family RNA polymerase sigma factor [Clostridia bacterium]|nr:sigma-70 family RNA polymerase sigma factor [Clostridia bacterium]